MTDTDRLAALLIEVFPAANRNQWPFAAMDVAASLAAAGVTVAAQPADDEHRYVEVVDADGDDWYGCICGCYLARPAPDALPFTRDMFDALQEVLAAHIYESEFKDGRERYICRMCDADVTNADKHAQGCEYAVLRRWTLDVAANKPAPDALCAACRACGRHDHLACNLDATCACRDTVHDCGVIDCEPAPDALRVAARAFLAIHADCDPNEHCHALRAALKGDCLDCDMNPGCCDTHDDPDRPLTRDEMLRYRVQHNVTTGLHPDAREKGTP